MPRLHGSDLLLCRLFGRSSILVCLLSSSKFCLFLGDSSLCTCSVLACRICLLLLLGHCTTEAGCFRCCGLSPGFSCRSCFLGRDEFLELLLHLKACSLSFS